MARLEIKAPPGHAGPLLFWNAEILVDGHHIKEMTALTLRFDMDGPGTAIIQFLVSEIEVDAEVMAMLEAIVIKKQQEVVA